MVPKQASQDELKEIIARTGFDYDLLTKDHYITLLLYLLKDLKGIYFKGGTALQLTLLKHARISEDIDFTTNKEIPTIRAEIETAINNSKLFGRITQDKDVDEFVRLIIPYKTSLGKDNIFIDLNKRAQLFLEPEQLEMKHFYPNIPEFTFPCLNRKEMVAEKVSAAIRRNKPRDHYDIYQIIKNNIEIDHELVQKKCEQTGNKYDNPKMFNKAKKLHKQWDTDMIPLLVEEVSFQEVMQTLAKHFKLQEHR